MPAHGPFLAPAPSMPSDDLAAACIRCGYHKRRVTPSYMPAGARLVSGFSDGSIQIPEGDPGRLAAIFWKDPWPSACYPLRLAFQRNPVFIMQGFWNMKRTKISLAAALLLSTTSYGQTVPNEATPGEARHDARDGLKVFRRSLLAQPSSRKMSPRNPFPPMS